MTGKNATYIEHRQAGSDSDEKREIIINGDVTVVEDDSNGKITPEKYIEQLKKKVRQLGNHFEDKEARDELQSIIHDWLHGKRDTITEIE